MTGLSAKEVGRTMAKAPASPKVKCRECDWEGRCIDRLVTGNPFEIGTLLYGCPQCKEINCFQLACDEDDCWKSVTCGTPTPSGYRNTCGTHKPAIIDEWLDDETDEEIDEALRELDRGRGDFWDG